MKKEEILNRVSDIIDFYYDGHKNPQNEKEKEEMEKSIEAGEIVEEHFKETYPE